MVLTRAEEELKQDMIQCRPGTTIGQKIKNTIRDASRNVRKKLTKHQFENATTKEQRSCDIVGFDDGIGSKLAIDFKNTKGVVKAQMREDAKTKAPKQSRGISLIKGRSTNKGIKNRGTAHQGKRRVHTKER
jgi:hypothetical protein